MVMSGAYCRWMIYLSSHSTLMSTLSFCGVRKLGLCCTNCHFWFIFFIVLTNVKEKATTPFSRDVQKFLLNLHLDKAKSTMIFGWTVPYTVNRNSVLNLTTKCAAIVLQTAWWNAQATDHFSHFPDTRAPWQLWEPQMNPRMRGSEQQ